MPVVGQTRNRMMIYSDVIGMKMDHGNSLKINGLSHSLLPDKLMPMEFQRVARAEE
ncbi:MAG: hypothetical protein HY730_00740 [Candidatus Tectomicrobia bacterium]|uniref:Uncharacterized protein n=1 Tax=Tectimicrobiota bacterium TaxID=2528274 RepID=A0A933LQ25_UNCTE|nr:hypothetical protein [Candidatus Tectomicrobia bacterium]